MSKQNPFVTWIEESFKDVPPYQREYLLVLEGFSAYLRAIYGSEGAVKTTALPDEARRFLDTLRIKTRMEGQGK